MTQALSVSLQPSRILALALTAMAGAALACAWISVPIAAFLPIAAGVTFAWAWHGAQALLLRDSAVRLLELDAKGGVRCQDGLGNWQEARILPGSYTSRWLVVLVLGAGGRRRSLVLLPDSAAPDELRRLRVWLRWRLGPQ